MNETIPNRLDIFRNLICQEINRLGGTEEDKSLALAATLGLDIDTIPAAINRAAKRWVADHCGLHLPQRKSCDRLAGRPATGRARHASGRSKTIPVLPRQRDRIQFVAAMLACG